MSVLANLRRFLRPDDPVLGRQCQRRIFEATDPLYAQRRAFEQRFSVGSPRDRILLGRGQRLDGTSGWFGLELKELVGGHAWIHGTTGAGKSFLAVIVALQLLWRQAVDFRLLDLKGEMSDLFLQVLLPALLATPGGEWLADRVLIIDPFGPTPPALQITLPEPGVLPQVQALSIAATLEEAVGADLGLRMERCLLWLAALAIELLLPLTILSRWLRTPALFVREAQRSKNPLLREYAQTSFLREPRVSLEALAGRLDLLLFLPQVRAALEAPTCISLDANRGPGVVIMKLGGAPAGCERAERVLASLMLARQSRAILSRNLRPDSVPLVTLFDEAQLAIRPRDVEHYERLATLSRFKACALVFCNQQAEQYDPGFARLLRTNTSVECIFACDPSSASALSGVLPVPLRVRSAGERRQRLTAQLVHLPKRRYVLWAKRLGFAAVLRSPRLDLDALREQAARVPSELRQRLLGGSPGPEAGSTSPEAVGIVEGQDPAVAPPSPSSVEHEHPEDGFPSLG